MATGASTAIVTGGASGVGRAIAERFLRDGTSVVVLTLSAAAHPDEVKHFASASEAAELSDLAGELGGTLELVEGDVAQEADVRSAVDAADRLGGAGFLVNCAATNTHQPIAGHDVAAWQRVLDVNLTGAFLAMRAVLPGMIERGFGRIVSIASTDASQGAPGYAAYCASKHGLLGLSRAAAKEVGEADVTVTTISPSWIDTPSARLHIERAEREPGESTDAAVTRLAEALPQRRLLSPGEVASLVAYVCGPDGRGLHGADLALTGGAER